MRETRCVFFHGVDWHALRARQQYLMAALSRYCPVVYLDGGRDARCRISSFQPLDKVTVIRGLVSLLSALGRRHLSPVARALATRTLARAVPAGSRVVFWSMENRQRPDRYIPYDLLVYDCMDPCFLAHPAALAAHDAREQAMLRDADVVFASAASLAELCRKSHSRVHLLNNACAPDDYSSGLLQAAKRPLWWPSGDRPVTAYLGSVDWRFDFESVRCAATARPDIQFVVAGNRLREFADEIAALEAFPNVICPGRLSLEEGRYLMAHCAIGLIAFTAGPMNDCINPVKLYAYALLGKPVVGTAIRELVSRPDIAITGERPEGFAAAVSEGLERVRDQAYTARLREFALANTWTHRAADAWAVLEPLL